jgi:glycosyltransferase involved in cell wall biosynthesis
MDDSVFISDYLTNASSFIASLDILLVPSEKETFGRVIIEAMSCKVPVIATNVGGIKEVIKDDYNGMLVPYGDYKLFAQKIEWLLQDHRLRKKYINNASKFLRENYNPRDYIKMFENIYKNAL